MNYCRAHRRGISTRPFVFIAASAAFTSACSGYYPLGETLEDGALVEAGGETAAVGDARVPIGLAPPDVTIGSDANEPGPGQLATVGDLDGDGRDEMAVSSVDFPNAVSFVQLRYGGPRPSDPEQVFVFERGGAFLTLPSDSGLAPSVASAGDVDADGYDDLLVRTEDCDSTTPHEGAYLLYGGPERFEGVLSLASVAARFVPSDRVANPPPGYGFSCSGARLFGNPGDLDGDGFDDIVITRDPINDTTSGAAIFGTGEGTYVFYGRRERFTGEVSFASADSTFHIAERVQFYPMGDIDGDGRADLMVTSHPYGPPVPGTFLLRGRAQRWSGPLDLAASASLLEGAYVASLDGVHNPGDLDGDGLDDVVLWDKDYRRHLFYGAPELFVAGIDFAQADATVGETAGQVHAVGDRDGDGDDELIDQFENPNVMELLPRFFSSNVAFASGSRERLSGTIPFPESEITAQAPDGRFPEQSSGRGDSGRTLRYAIPAGDLDGDGAADLFTTSAFYEIVDDSSYETTVPQIHIHYGVPAQPDVIVR